MPRDKAIIRINDYRPTEDEVASVAEVLRSGQLSEGEKVAEFEEEWTRYIGTRYSVAFCSGSAALLSGLLATRNLGLLQGNAILTNPNTYVGTVNCISLAGYSPVFTDIEPRAFGSMAIDKVNQLVEAEDQISRIAAVIPVHLFGFPERMPELGQIGIKSGVLLLEDAAQAHGSELLGRKLGSWGYFGIFSFYMGHTLQASEMGAVTTDSFELFEQLKIVKDQGRPFRTRRNRRAWFTSEWIGFNFKTTEINAAIALAQLQRIDEIVRLRRRNASLLSKLLSEWSDVLQLPDFPDDVCPFAYPILIRTNSIHRDALCELVEAMGVETRPMFPCIPMEQPAYMSLQGQYEGRLPNSEFLSRQAFYVGCHQYLSEDEVTTIAQVISCALKNILTQEVPDE